MNILRFLKQKKVNQISFSVLALCLVLSAGVYIFSGTTNTAQAQTCSTESFGSLTAYAQAETDRTGRGDRRVTDSDTTSIDVSNYVGQGEYASSISADAQLSADIGSNCRSCEAEGVVSISIDGSQQGSMSARTTRSGGYDSNQGTVSVNMSEDENPGTITVEASAVGDVYQNDGTDATGDADASSITLEICESDGGNSPPNAYNDNVNYTECDSFSTQYIDVLANDSDPDGDSIAIRDYDFESQNGGQVDSASGQLAYTPSQLGNDQFGYTITDGNRSYDSATVYVDVNADNCGSVGVNVNYSDGNPNGVTADSIQANYGGLSCQGTNSNNTQCSVDLTESGTEASISQADIDPPPGYQFANNWIDKNTSGSDGYPDDQTRSILSF